MKFGSIVVGAALIATQPATAQSLADGVDRAPTRIGAFAGLRTRVSLGGIRREPVRAALTLTSTRVLNMRDRGRQTALGEGLEFGFAGSRRATWSLAGQPLSAQVERRNMTTAGKVALIAGGVLLIGGVGFLILLHEAEKNSD